MDVVESSRQGRQDPTPLASRGFTAPLERATSVEGSRVLVIDRNMLTAEAIVLALRQMALTARFVMPVTIAHLRDLVTWRPRLALLDIDSVAHGTCIECVTILRDAGVPVVVMGGKSDAYLLGNCVHAGAASVVDKGSPLDELVGVIMGLLEGNTALSEDAKRTLTEPFHREVRARQARLAPFDVLTQREKYVLGELMEGRGAEVIAEGAMVSISTVRSQIKAILQKLGVNSQLAAASLGRQAGWTYDPDQPVASSPALAPVPPQLPVPRSFPELASA